MLTGGTWPGYAAQVSESPFDAGAAAFTADVDASIAHDRYLRGRLFVGAVRRHLALDGSAGRRVLDIGCGPGRIARLLAEAGYDVTGADPSPMMLAEARRQPVSGGSQTHLRFVDGDGTAELAHGPWSAIVLSSVLEFVPDADTLLCRAADALAPGGILVVSYANRASLWRRWSQPHRVAQHLWLDGEMRRRLVAAGLRPITRTRYFDCAPLDRRGLGRLGDCSRVGTLGLLVAKRP
jgi:SAM-dependent methyltransferase